MPLTVARQLVIFTQFLITKLYSLYLILLIVWQRTIGQR